jgi:hypothetical protein
LGTFAEIQSMRLPFPSYILKSDVPARLTEAGELNRCKSMPGDMLIYAKISALDAWAGFSLGQAERLEKNKSTPEQRLAAVVNGGLAVAQGWFHHPHRVEYDALVDRWVSLVVRSMAVTPTWHDVLIHLPAGAETAIHSVRLAITIAYFASYFGWATPTQKSMVQAALGHDIGYSLDNLPRGDGHVSAGLALLRARRSLSETMYYGILHHHERFDGSGQPFGLKETQIPWSAQVLGLLDSWDEQTQITGSASVLLAKWQRFIGEEGSHFETRWLDSMTQILESTDSLRISATTS